MPSDHQDMIDKSEVTKEIERLMEDGHTHDCAISMACMPGQDCTCTRPKTKRPGYRVSNGDQAGEMPVRKQVTDAMYNDAIWRIRRAFYAVIKRKGDGMFASPHETLGVLQTEMRELVAAIGDRRESRDIMHELMDIIVPAMIGLISLKYGYPWPPDHKED